MNSLVAARGAAVRALNSLGSRFVADGRWLARLDASTLMRRAERATGLMDWGSADFMPGLERLLASLDEEAALSTMGRLMLANGMQRFLTNRLKLQRDWTLHPEILALPVIRPIFIIGLPRTGSTLLQRLLARAPGARSLQIWEMMEPSAPLSGRDTRERDTARRLKLLEWAAPEFLVAHEVKVGEPEECVTLLQNGFVTDAFELMASVPSYRQWVESQDLDASYRYYRAQLQTLQWQQTGRHWVLKSPFHQLGLASILKLFPDALIVQTHREPAQVVPSWCSLFSAMHELTVTDLDRHELGRQRLRGLAQSSRRVIEVRERVGDARFVDVAFDALMADPIAVAREIHARADLPLSAAGESGMRDWLAQNQRHKRGVHRYTLEEFGLDEAGVNLAMQAYRQRFAAQL